VTTDTYTNAGQLATRTTGYGTSAASTTSYCYDPDGNTTAVVAPDGNTSGTAPCETSFPWTVSSNANPTQAAYQTSYGYDSSDELVSTTRPATTAAPSGSTTTATYDPAGNELTTTDPDGITTTYAYTPLNLTSSVSYSGSSAHSVTYTYDASGNKTGMTDATGSSSYIYDPFGELTSAINGAGQTTGYGYDADGDTTGITYPLPSTATWAASDTVSYGYDNADRLTSATDFVGNKITITNTADGLPSSQALGSTGDTIATTYGSTDAPSVITLKNSSSTLASISYAAAPAGEILTETDSPSVPTSPSTYSYDGQGRVTSMTPGTGSQLSYSFDASGNLVSAAGGSAIYDHAGEVTSATLSGTNFSFTYNADGEELNVTAAGTTVASGSWNGARELTAYNDSDGDLTAATYDGNGLRASSTGNPVGGSATSQQYVWDTIGQTPLLLMDSTNAYIYDGSGTPAEQVNLSTGTITYLAADSLGSVRATVNSSGAITGATSYDAMGNPLTTGGLSSATPFGFAGGYTDPTGLIYFLNRYYDPVLGQFISVDPMVAQTEQPYEYSGGDPVNATDPAGDLPIPHPDPGGCYNSCPSSSVQSTQSDTTNSCGVEVRFTGQCPTFSSAEPDIVGWAKKAGTGILGGIAGLLPFFGTVVGGGAGPYVVDAAALAKIEQHLRSIDAWEKNPENIAMVTRVRDALSAGRALTEAEANFVVHELTEADVVSLGVEQEAAHLIAMMTHPTFANYELQVIEKFFYTFNIRWVNYWRNR
jgi:RHS repeat-associated protein